MPLGRAYELQLELDRLSVHLQSLQRHMVKIRVAAGGPIPSVVQIMVSEIDSGQCRLGEQRAG
jgi:hypothetical protein